MVLFCHSAVPESEAQATPSPEESSPPAPDAETAAPSETTEPPQGYLLTFLFHVCMKCGLGPKSLESFKMYISRGFES